MNLICCTQNCKHQQDGYCVLDQIARLTNSGTSPCGYFEEKDPPSTQNSQHIQDRPNR